jgi:hypothetical protein
MSSTVVLHLKKFKTIKPSEGRGGGGGCGVLCCVVQILPCFVSTITRGKSFHHSVPKPLRFTFTHLQSTYATVFRFRARQLKTHFCRVYRSSPPPPPPPSNQTWRGRKKLAILCAKFWPLSPPCASETTRPGGRTLKSARYLIFWSDVFFVILQKTRTFFCQL